MQAKFYRKLFRICKWTAAGGLVLGGGGCEAGGVGTILEGVFRLVIGIIDVAS